MPLHYNDHVWLGKFIVGNDIDIEFCTIKIIFK